MDPDLDRWLKRVRQRFEMQVRQVHIGNQFIEGKIRISDPCSIGLEFDICYNSDGKVSILDSGDLKIDRFNIAEGYSTTDIVSGAQQILEGDYKIKKSWIRKKTYIILQTSKGEVSAKVLKGGYTGPRCYPAKTQ